MARYKQVGDQRVLMTAQEEAALAAEELDWETNEKPQLIREENFRNTAEAAGSQFTPIEKLVLLAAWTEVQRYRIDNTARTPLVDAFQAVFPGQTKTQVGVTIENRVENFLTTAATALAQKIKDGG